MIYALIALAAFFAGWLTRVLREPGPEPSPQLDTLDAEFLRMEREAGAVGRAIGRVTLLGPQGDLIHAWPPEEFLVTEDDVELADPGREFVFIPENDICAVRANVVFTDFVGHGPRTITVWEAPSPATLYGGIGGRVTFGAATKEGE
jgi:hypothetical protein